MKDYQSSKNRVVLGLIAVAMTAITMGALVVLPAEFESRGAFHAHFHSGTGNIAAVG